MWMMPHHTIPPRIPFDPELLPHLDALHDRQNSGDAEVVGQTEQSAVAFEELLGRLGLGKLFETLGGPAEEETAAAPCCGLVSS